MQVRERPIESTGASAAALASGENFVVASRLLPRQERSHLMAVYGYARLVDDIGDESAGDRLTELDWVEAELDRAFAGVATHPVLVRLQSTIAACRLERQPFVDLIEANRRDQTVKRYATWDDLIGYCALSADPVGRIVLTIFDAATPERIARSDDVCSGLQVVEHLQDVGEDARNGRVYLPAEVLGHFGCPDEALTQPFATPSLRAAVAEIAGRARTLLASGVPLARSLRGRPRWAVAGFCAGGLAVLDAIADAGNDVLGNRIRPARAATVRHAITILRGRTQ
jgi:squalene synthase HpnC